MKRDDRHTHPMISNGDYNNQFLEISDEQISLNKMYTTIEEIFDRELALPEYYNEKILLGGVE